MLIRKQIITEVLLYDDFSNLQNNMNEFGFTNLKQYIDYLDDCYSHETNLCNFKERFLADYKDASENS